MSHMNGHMISQLAKFNGGGICNQSVGTRHLRRILLLAEDRTCDSNIGIQLVEI